MDDLSSMLEQKSHDERGALTIEREQAIAATRARGVGAAEASDEMVWSTWLRHGNGPTNHADLDRVVAELQGIALDS
jgi:hypothetical protein